MRPESEIREHISRYEVKSFTEGVKKFWGGECAAIVMKDAENIDEVVELLRPLVQRDE